MNLEQLRYFLTIYESLSLNIAAKQLYISQPALSKSLQTMEQELGTKLFIRNKKGLYPTEAGKIFFESSTSILQLYDETLLKLNSNFDFKETLTIFAVPSIANIYFPSVLKNLCKDFPNLKLHFSEIFPEEITFLHKTMNSFAITMGGAEIDSFTNTFPEYISIPLKSELCYAFVSKYSSWAKEKQICTDNIDEQSIDFRKFSSSHQYIKHYTAKNLSSNSLLSQELILSQNGIHILPIGLGQKIYKHPDILAIPLKNDTIVTYSLVTSKTMFSSEFSFILRYIIKLLKHILQN